MKAVEGWKISNLEDLVHLDLESLGEQTPADFAFYYLDIGSISEGKIAVPSSETLFREAPSRARKIIHRGDVLMSTVRPNLKAFAYFDHGDATFIASTGFAVLTAKKDTDPRFILYAILSDATSRQIESFIIGSNYPAINSCAVRRLRILTPPKPVQTTIAEILSTVDRAIEQTEVLIAKQQRIKTGLMQDLLTRGIDEHGNPRSESTHAFKDSQLGRIPADWEVTPAHELCTAVIDCKNRTPPTTSEGHPVIRTPNVRNGKFVLADLAFTDSASYEIWVARGKPRPGDVVITREAPFGEACQIPNDLLAPCLGQRMMMYQTDLKKMLPDYLVCAIQSAPVQTKLLELAGGSTVGHIRVGDIRKLPIPHPVYIKEQVSIAVTIAASSATLENLQLQQQKLTSVKSALMQDLLTGKRRVTTLLEAEPKRERLYG